ncbi:MAG: zinc ribbon domain-containing protein [Kiritimatiellae bacterium]|nr:zinc ribbon domain-containing protein [Kiritimatiellia bacterium]
MPTYEYECLKCGHTFEKFQSMTEERLKACPECKGRVNRLFGTGAGIIFKGAGFYETDYRSSSYQKGAQKASSSSAAAKASEKKTPEKKSSTKSASSDSKTSKAGKGKSDA